MGEGGGLMPKRVLLNIQKGKKSYKVELMNRRVCHQNPFCRNEIRACFEDVPVFSEEIKRIWKEKAKAKLKVISPTWKRREVLEVLEKSKEDKYEPPIFAKRFYELLNPTIQKLKEEGLNMTSPKYVIQPNVEILQILP